MAEKVAHTGKNLEMMWRVPPMKILQAMSTLDDNGRRELEEALCI